MRSSHDRGGVTFRSCSYRPVSPRPVRRAHHGRAGGRHQAGNELVERTAAEAPHRKECGEGTDGAGQVRGASHGSGKATGFAAAYQSRYVDANSWLACVGFALRELFHTANPNRQSDMSCAQCEGIEDQFDRGEARKKLRHFRRRGPDRTTRMLIEDLRATLAAGDVHDAVLLDIGAGVGAIHHQLLEDRVSRAVHVDASTAQLAAAKEETERRGHSSRVEFLFGDFVALADTIASADIVTLDRVICCFDDMHGLVQRSARKAGRFYGAVYPRQIGWMRIAIASINLLQRLKRSTFRVFLHDPGAIDAELRGAGLERRSRRQTLGWEVVVYARAS